METTRNLKQQHGSTIEKMLSASPVCPLKPNLVVYTTRLDDMIVFSNDTSKTTIVDALQKIEQESKPTLPKKPKMQVFRNNRLASYLHLKKKIITLNKNKHAVKRFKERNITDEIHAESVALGNSVGDFTQNNTILKSTTFKTSENNRRLPTSEDKRIDPVVWPVTTKVDYENTSNLCMVKKRFETDLYILDDDGNIIRHEKKKSQKMNMQEINLVVNYCCWFNREQIVAHLSKRLKPTTLRRIKNAHTCIPGQCKCCCKPNSNNYCMFSIDDYIDPTDNDVKEPTKEPETNSDFDDLLKKMLVSKKCPDDYLLQNLPNDTNVPTVKTSKVSFLNENNQYNCYETDINGEVIQSQTHCKGNFDTEDSYYGKVCCWYARENIIKKLIKEQKPESILTRIKEKHLCPSDKCTCCCKTLNPANLRRIGNADNCVPGQSKGEPNNSVAVFSDDYIDLTDNDLENNVKEPIKEPEESISFDEILKKMLVSKRYADDYLLKKLSNNKDVNVSGPKTSKVSFLNENNQYNHYETDINGEVIQSLTFEGGDFETKDSYYGKVCCWYARENIIKKLKEEQKPASILTCIKKKHFCPIDKCTCCCKPEELILPENSLHSGKCVAEPVTKKRRILKNTPSFKTKHGIEQNREKEKKTIDIENENKTIDIKVEIIDIDNDENKIIVNDNEKKSTAAEDKNKTMDIKVEIINIEDDNKTIHIEDENKAVDVKDEILAPDTEDATDIESGRKTINIEDDIKTNDIVDKPIDTEDEIGAFLINEVNNNFKKCTDVTNTIKSSALESCSSTTNATHEIQENIPSSFISELNTSSDIPVIQGVVAANLSEISPERLPSEFLPNFRNISLHIDEKKKVHINFHNENCSLSVEELQHLNKILERTQRKVDKIIENSNMFINPIMTFYKIGTDLHKKKRENYLRSFAECLDLDIYANSPSYLNGNNKNEKIKKQTLGSRAGIIDKPVKRTNSNSKRIKSMRGYIPEEIG